VTNHLQDNLEIKLDHLQWIRRVLDQPQKAERVCCAWIMFEALDAHARTNWQNLTTGDDSGMMYENVSTTQTISPIIPSASTLIQGCFTLIHLSSPFSACPRMPISETLLPIKNGRHHTDNELNFTTRYIGERIASHGAACWSRDCLCAIKVAASAYTPLENRYSRFELP
jgi:hypothetical protein